jgi:hypothetical protein
VVASYKGIGCLFATALLFSTVQALAQVATAPVAAAADPLVELIKALA